MATRHQWNPADREASRGLAASATPAGAPPPSSSSFLLDAAVGAAAVGAALLPILFYRRRRRHLLAVPPDAVRLGAVGLREGPLPVLPAALPLPPVDTAVGEHESAFAMPHVILVAPLVLGAVRGFHPAGAGHLTNLPLALVLAAVGERVRALAVHLVAPELALVRHLLGAVDAEPVLASAAEFAFVSGIVGPAFYALPVHLVPMPLALVGAAVGAVELAVPVLLVQVPLTLVHDAVLLGVDPLAMGLGILESAFVSSPVQLDQHALPMHVPAPPLPRVPCATLHLNLGFFYQPS
eukprot:CAMPEP_0179238126 /NCGR_PEP_ID=MMETSP0797-20121207/14791_1 /TAXON_ID=47934 /ORGANISM="Dinophysis acuminata, Strain DAEP01" /LENGTH=294 /DNA_ID=CAMNT_0020945421 /DNA_START=119 /DNA_END=1003 /DNA_ORIENTATION=-